MDFHRKWTFQDETKKTWKAELPTLKNKKMRAFSNLGKTHFFFSFHKIPTEMLAHDQNQWAPNQIVVNHIEINEFERFRHKDLEWVEQFTGVARWIIGGSVARTRQHFPGCCAQSPICFISGSSGLVVQVLGNYIAFSSDFGAFHLRNSSNCTYSALIEVFREVVQIARFSILPK